MPVPRSRELTYLRAYLRENSKHPMEGRGVPAGIAVIATVFLVMFGMYLFTTLIGVASIIAFPISLIIMLALNDGLNRKLKQPRNEEERRQIVAFEHAQEINTALMRRHLDPLAGRLLDACAFHRQRIEQATAGSEWQTGQLGTIRADAMRAADEGLHESLALATRFVGPDFGPGAAWKDLAQDVAEGKLGGAAKRLKTMLEADSPGDIVDRRDLPQPLWPIYETAVKMQRLASEIEITGKRLATEPATSQTSSLDHVLSNLSAMREAQAELDQELRQGT